MHALFREDAVAIVRARSPARRAHGPSRPVPNVSRFVEASGAIVREWSAVGVFTGAAGMGRHGAAKLARRVVAARGQSTTQLWRGLRLPRPRIQLTYQGTLEATFGSARTAQACLIDAAAGRYLVAPIRGAQPPRGARGRACRCAPDCRGGEHAQQECAPDGRSPPATRLGRPAALGQRDQAWRSPPGAGSNLPCREAGTVCCSWQ